MKYSTILVLFFSFFSAHSQPPTKGERRLTHYILKECNWSDGIDSARVGAAVKYLFTLYGVKRVRFIRNTTGSSHFIPFIGTLFINYKDTMNICTVLSAELAHAAQFSSAPLYYARKTLLASIETFFVSFMLNREERKEVRRLVREKGCPRWKAKLWVAWGRQYHRATTLEGEAHQRIQPMVYEQLMLAIYNIPLEITAQAQPLLR